MKRDRWIQWLLVLVALHALGLAISALLWFQEARGAAQAVAAVAGVLITAWLFYGLWSWRRIGTVRIIGAALSVTYLVAALALYLLWVGKVPSAIAMTGIWAMGTAFLLGLAFIRFILSPGWPVLGIARTLVDEAIRMKIALIFIVGVALLIPVLPLLLDPNELLNYRLKTFLSWAVSGTSLLLSLMTIFLACATITQEIYNRQIYLTMSKPVGRGSYLLGKWLGIALLNLLLVLVAGGGIYTFARFMQAQPARDMPDRQAVDQQVLVARLQSRPTPGPQMNMAAMLEDHIAQLRRAFPETYGTDEAPKVLAPRDRDAARNAVIAKWHTLPPRGSQVYVFTGLSPAKAQGPWVQLRFKPKASRAPSDQMVDLGVFINDRPYAPVRVADNTFHVLDLPTQLIDDQGQITLRVANLMAQPPPESEGLLMTDGETAATSITFPPGDGLEILFRVGSFEGNLVRALAIVWLQLGFLAALGLMAGTFLGFAVACVLSLLVYIVGISSGFLVESLKFYTASAPAELSTWGKLLWVPTEVIAKLGDGAVWDAMKIIIKLFGSLVVWALPSLSEFSPSAMVADGRLVPAQMVFDATWQMGLLWTGLVGVIAWLIFRRREVAAVTSA